MGSLRGTDKVGEWGESRSGRVLQSIRRDMDLKDAIFRVRRRNEEILSLSYRDGQMIGGGADTDNLRENALNLPYRYVRWLESQATSKKLVVKVGRDAGEGQRPGGPGDNVTGMWVGITLARAAQIAGFEREMKSVIGEVSPRGTSAMRIGYHEQHITIQESREAGKDSQSIVPDVLGQGDVEAKKGQAHGEAAEGLMNMAEDEKVQLAAGQAGVAALLARADSHAVAGAKEETDTSPIESTRLIRRRVWMRKMRVGEDCGWAPHVYDVEDTPYWWERNIWTVAEVKASGLFTEKFKKEVKGYDGRNVSGVLRGGQTPSTDSMGSDARQAQTEDVLDDDERMVEWFTIWFRRPDMKAGGYVKIVSPECPADFVEASDMNPHVDEKGYGLIPGFFPFYDFTPVQSSLTVPERTTGIPPIAVGMTQFEKIAEYGRLCHESALRHSLRMYEIDPMVKDKKRVMDAIKNGEDGFSWVADMAQMDQSGKLRPGVTPIQFTGNTQEIERQAAREESDWIKMMGMPPAILQGQGTADTLGQDEQGIAAGERESGALISYFEKRTGDMLAGIRGLIRGNYDDEDFVAMLGEEGAAVMKAWQTGTSDDGDPIEVTFGARAMAQEAVEKKQLMEAITLIRASVEPLTGLPMYDETPWVEELARRLDLGAPPKNAGVTTKLQQMVMQLSTMVEQLTGVNPVTGAGAQQAGGGQSRPGQPGQNGKEPGGGGPNKSEGESPNNSNIGAGAKRGTLPPTAPRPGATQTY